MRIFCDWSEPFLPAVARHLLDATQGTLADWTVVTRGRASGRRLLFLLASEATARGLSLRPPRLLTLGSLPNEWDVPLVSPLLSRLAWNCVLRQTPHETLEAVWKSRSQNSVVSSQNDFSHLEGGSNATRSVAGGAESPTKPSEQRERSMIPERSEANSLLTSDSCLLTPFLESTSRELDAAGLSFRSAFTHLEETLREQGEEHVARWQALAEIEDHYTALLAQWGFTTTTQGLQDARWNAEKKLALVGLIECPDVFTDFFERTGIEASVFIHAPESEAQGFDMWGRLNVAYWKKHPLAIPCEAILRAEDTAGQVAAVAQCLEKWCGSSGGNLPAQAVTLALPDNNATADFEMGLADCGIPARAAGGRSLAHGEVATLLETLAALCETPRAYAPLARLLRQPQAQAWLRSRDRTDQTELSDPSPAALDAYFNTHLPETLTLPAEPKLQATLDKIAASCTRLNLASGDSGNSENSGESNELIIHSILPSSPSSPISHCGETASSFPRALRKLLEEIFADKPMLHRERDRALLAGLEEAMAAIEQIESLPCDALKAFSASELLHEIAASVARASVPEPENPQAIEIAGWLEAALDDAPAMIVASVYDGVLPETVPNEPLLHDGLRERLGMPCRATRYVRDQYTLWSVSSPRKGLFALVAPRRDGEGALVRPSRLLLAGLEGEVLAERVLWLMGKELEVRSQELGGSPSARVPRGEAANDILTLNSYLLTPSLMRSHRTFTVTSFVDYLRSPRLFYFKHVLGLRETDDTAREMEASVFGTFAHEVLRRFGKNHLGREEHTLDSRAIKREMDGILDTVYAETFGSAPLAALPLQREVLRTRLAAFAEKQAALFAVGWQIVEVERKCETPFADAILKGKIDRIDFHAASGQWRVLDYKTGSASEPTKQHFSQRTKVWRDLQFPLYAKLLGSSQNAGVKLPTPLDTPDSLDALQDANPTDYCYFHLSAELDKIGVSEPFDNDLIEAGWDEAARIVREVTSGEGCRDVGKFTRYDSPTFVALCGGDVADESEEGGEP